jgi:DNA replication protein DnaC
MMELPPEQLSMISKWVKNPKYFMMWMGSSGTGKTALAAGMIDYMIRHSVRGSRDQKFNHYRYWKEYDFFNKVRGSFDLQGDSITTIKNMMDDDFIFYDDMKSPSEWRREQIEILVDIRYCSMKPTVFTTNFTRDEIFSKYGAATWDRLFAKENVIIDTHGQPSRRQS